MSKKAIKTHTLDQLNPFYPKILIEDNSVSLVESEPSELPQGAYILEPASDGFGTEFTTIATAGHVVTFRQGGEGSAEEALVLVGVLTSDDEDKITDPQTMLDNEEEPEPGYPYEEFPYISNPVPGMRFMTNYPADELTVSHTVIFGLAPEGLLLMWDIVDDTHVLTDWAMPPGVFHIVVIRIEKSPTNFVEVVVRGFTVM